MTKLQAQALRQDVRQQQIEKKLAQPRIELVTPDTPYIPNVESRQGGYLAPRVVLRDATGRKIDL